MKKIVALLLAVVMMLGLLAGCAPADDEPSASRKPKPSDGTPVNKEDLPVLDVYPYTALSAGVDTSFRSDVYADNGFQVNIWAWSAEKTNSILTSGNLPDIMYVEVGDTLDTLIETGKILNLEDYLEDLSNLNDNPMMQDSLDYLRSAASAGTGSVYGLPVGIGVYSGTFDHLNPVAGNILKLKWEAYEKIGSPEIKDYWQLLDVMEDMLEAMPTHPDGTKMYGTILNSGTDSAYWGCMTYWFAQQGYMYNNLKFLLELDMEDSTMSSILEDNSMYYQGLKWYNAAMRRGLIDPDSINTDIATQATKVDNGYAMVPMGHLPGYPGGGYYPYLIEGTTLYYPGATYIANRVMVINAETEYLEECLAYLNMMCSVDQAFELMNGPEGDLWERNSDGAIVYTEKYQAWLDEGKPINGYPMSDGAEYSPTLNLPSVHLGGEPTSYKNADGGDVNVSLGLKEASASFMETDAFKAWQEDSGYDTPREMIQDVGYISLPDYDQFKGYLSTKPEDELLVLTQSALKEIVCTASWKMVYAKTDAEFEALWDKMVSDCIASGAQELIEWRLEDVKEAREEWESMK